MGITHLRIGKSSRLVILALFLNSSLLAQHLISSQGGFYLQSEGSVSFSLGEVVTSIHSNNTGSVQQGFQQNYLPNQSVALNINRNKKDIKIYPNPFSTHIQISLNDLDAKLFIFKIYHISGREISAGNIESQQQSINTAHFQPGSYILAIASKQISQSITYLLIKK